MISVKTLTINYLRDMEIIIPPLALAFKQTKEEEKEKKTSIFPCHRDTTFLH